MTEEFSSTNQQKAEPFPPSSAHDSAQGVTVPGEVPAEGTSEGAAPVDGVRATAIAPEGLADGENDVRMPPTTTF